MEPQPIPYHKHNSIDGTPAINKTDLDWSGVPGVAITKPTGGATQDAEARAAIDSIIDFLVAAGLIQ